MILQDLERAYDECDKADLIVCLGSSLTVSPANDLPKRVAKRGGNLVIVNLQRTPLDSLRYYEAHFSFPQGRAIWLTL